MKKILFIFFIFFIFFYFRNPIFNVFTSVSHFVFKPVLVLGKNFSTNLSNLKIILNTKKSLTQENEELNLLLNKQKAMILNYEALLNENIELKEIFNYNSNKNSLILANILAKPANSIYDTLIIDQGFQQGISVNKKVFAFGYILIGYIGAVEANSSKVVLYSSPREKITTYFSFKTEDQKIENIFLEINGQGGGNFEVILPKDLNLEPKTNFFLPGSFPYLVAHLVKNISKENDSLQRAILISPVNVQSLKFVQVEI